MKIAIIGAGISGLIASGAFLKDRRNIVTIFDPKKNNALSGHKAVMRLRNDKIKDYVFCQLKEVTVYKAVYHEGRIYNEANILLNNLYSRKTSSSLGERSLLSLGKVKRFMITNIESSDVCSPFNLKVVGLKDSQLILDNGVFHPYDVCISTIPMPTLLTILGISHRYGISFRYSPVIVTTMDLHMMSDVHQTIYFTDADSKHPYRVTIEGTHVIMESLFPVMDNNVQNCLKAFGLSMKDVNPSSVKQHKQPIGKLHPIDDDIRKRVMGDITSEFNIYSFGRFATWKPLRIDQTLDDIEKIKDFVRIKNKGWYE